MSTTEQPRPPGMHPRHPGVGSSTSLIRLEADEPERGGLLIFFPSGRHMTIAWRTVTQITPTKEAALQYTGQIVDNLNKVAAKEGRDSPAETDLARTNWVSVTAAIQRIILDFNQALSARVSAKMALEFGPVWPPKPH